MPNAKYLAHLAHQTQKQSFIRCAKCAKFLQHAIVPLHFAMVRTQMAFVLNYFFIIHLSLSSHSATPSTLFRILLCLIALSLVKDGFQCEYILAWVKWWCGSWVWRHGGSQRHGLWQGGSRQWLLVAFVATVVDVPLLSWVSSYWVDGFGPEERVLGLSFELLSC